jgi:hypothetical protein
MPLCARRHQYETAGTRRGQSAFRTTREEQPNRPTARPAQALPFAGLLPTCTSPASRRRKPLPVERTSQGWDMAWLNPPSPYAKESFSVGDRHWPIRAAARSGLFEFTEGWCNLHRLRRTPGLPHFRATAAWPATAQPQVGRPTTRSQRAACAPHRWRPSIRTSPRSKSGHEPTPFVVAGPLSSVCCTGCEVFVWAEVR